MSEAGNLHFMSSKDQEQLYKKVCELHRKGTVPNCLKQIDVGKDSYYEERESLYKGIRDYSVSNVSALREELQLLWKDSELKELIPIVIASTFKARERLAAETQETETQYEGELPQYIYNF